MEGPPNEQQSNVRRNNVAPENLQPTINIGTLGHVAHGKSTIIRGLTGVSTGRFRLEKERNMTIQLGYANIKIFRCTNEHCPKPWCYQSGAGSLMTPPLCKRKGCGLPSKLVMHASLVDSPGHHDLMATMLSGAAIMDAALLVVAANEPCPCPQTVEHLQAGDLLGITARMLVAQNKVDLVGVHECFDHHVAIKYLLKDSPGKDSPIIPVLFFPLPRSSNFNH